MSDLETRELVRQRYAAAATVLATGSGAATSAAGCCGSAPDEGSCCGDTAVVDKDFGAALYGADEQSELPAQALAASQSPGESSPGTNRVRCCQSPVTGTESHKSAPHSLLAAPQTEILAAETSCSPAETRP